MWRAECFITMGLLKKEDRGRLFPCIPNTQAQTTTHTQAQIQSPPLIHMDALEIGRHKTMYACVFMPIHPHTPLTLMRLYRRPCMN